ncbi:GroES-like protein [Vibrio phage 1.244.A._10N.261.54.C3]|nr:GroES-like protein [Vibrio phage 1.244.A._10N.261.54.C3]AUR98652.1 GroES-like protein [Vibrio phage 1.255.O._10N.286.45.F1]
MALKPLFNNVLIEPVDIQRTNNSGLVLTSSSKQVEPTTGVVLSMGDDCDGQRKALIGKTVSFVVGASPYEKAELVDGKKMLLVPQENIIGVFE